MPNDLIEVLQEKLEPELPQAQEGPVVIERVDPIFRSNILSSSKAKRVTRDNLKELSKITGKDFTLI